MTHETDMPSNVIEAVRAACLEAAVGAYEDAGIQGLCADGRWEAALAAIRQVDLSRVVDGPAASTPVGDSRRDAPPVSPAGGGSPV
jgi:hypothetical protein